MTSEDRIIWPASDWGAGEASPADISVPVEKAVDLMVDDKHLVTFHCTPEHLDELATGFVLDQGIIACAGDIRRCAVVDGERVELTLKEGARRHTSTGGPVIYSGCGQSGKGAPAPVRPEAVQGSTVFPATALRDALAGTLRRGELYRQTRGVHSAALYSRKGRLLVLREDIGRHNALDKILGWAAAQCLEPDRLFAAASGRISAEAVDKLARFGIAVMVAKGMPTSLALEKAGSLGITLAGGIGSGRLRIYTHKEKIQT